MIPILLQESECWDRYTILEVKIFGCNNQENKSKLKKDLLDLQNQMDKYIGYEKNNEVYHSAEYCNLYNVNFEIFEFINRAEKEDLFEKELNGLNHRRYLCKKKLQEVWFGTEIKELKIGYENVKNE